MTRAPRGTPTPHWSHIFLVAAWAQLILAGAARSEESGAAIGKEVADWKLVDYRGEERTLAELAGGKPTVVVFVGTECPLARLYGPRVAALAEEYGPKGVHFVGIDSNLQDSLTKVAAFARQCGIAFPILMDPDGRVADLFTATRSPEAFLLDGRRVICYHGRIDDQYGIGYQRASPQRRDLAVALDELLAGQSVSVSKTELAGCRIGRAPSIAPRGEVTYSRQIARIFARRCVECHRAGEIGPFPLTTYGEIKGWAPMIQEVVDEGRMPPWFAAPGHARFANDSRLAEDERTAILTWIENGIPEGDPADLPEPPRFASGWRIPEPDLVIPMSDRPVRLKANGAEGYKNFMVDPGFKQDVWVKAAEARPGNRAVVHHHLAYFVPPLGNRTMSQMLHQIAGYAPGTPPFRYPQGTAMRIPAGSKIHFQMHYTPIGTEQEDLSSVGIVFADPETVRYEVNNQMALNFDFKIPAGVANFPVEAKYRCGEDTILLNLAPHMHLRGKSFRFELVKPGGARQVLLDVPRYDFHWQLRYDLLEPMRLTKGSWIHCKAVFDNSAGNPNNPDPTRVVDFGEQTWEEMMVGVFQVLKERNPEPGATAGRAQARAAVVGAEVAN